MSYSYLLLERAQDEFENSLKWYLEKSELSANNFISETDKAIQLICQRPYSHHNRYKNFYEFRMKIFPFTIVYVIEAEKKLIVISSVFHHKRNPKRKYKK